MPTSGRGGRPIRPEASMHVNAVMVAMMALQAPAGEPWALWKSPASKTPYRQDIPEAEKIAGLSKLWSEVKFNFANFDLVPALDWDAEYLAAIPRARATRSTLEYYRLLQELTAKLRDGHTNVRPPLELRAEMSARPALRTRLVEERVVVVRVDDPALGIAIGDEVLEVEGMPVRRYAEERVRPFLSASTPQDLDVRTYERFLLAGPESVPVRLLLRARDGSTAIKAAPRSIQPLAPLPVVQFRVLPGNVGYLALNTFNDERVRSEYDAVWKDVAATDALVIDLRENDGGNGSHGFYVLSTLAREPFRTARWRTRRYLPSHRAWNRPEQWDENEGGTVAIDAARRYDKPVVLLIGERTYSAAEDFSVAFDSAKRGAIIGVPSGGSTGQPLPIDLPGGGSAGICTKRDTYPDGREFVGVGVQPHVVVRTTIDDLRAGRDPVLDRALLEIGKPK